MGRGCEEGFGRIHRLATQKSLRIQNLRISTLNVGTIRKNNVEDLVMEGNLLLMGISETRIKKNEDRTIHEGYRLVSIGNDTGRHGKIKLYLTLRARPRCLYLHVPTSGSACLRAVRKDGGPGSWKRKKDPAEEGEPPPSGHQWSPGESADPRISQNKQARPTNGDVFLAYSTRLRRCLARVQMLTIHPNPGPSRRRRAGRKEESKRHICNQKKTRREEEGGND